MFGRKGTGILQVCLDTYMTPRVPPDARHGTRVVGSRDTQIAVYGQMWHKLVAWHYEGMKMRPSSP